MHDLLHDIEPEAQTLGARSATEAGLKRLEQTRDQIGSDRAAIPNAGDHFRIAAGELDRNRYGDRAVPERVADQIREHLSQAPRVPASVHVSRHPDVDWAARGRGLEL